MNFISDKLQQYIDDHSMEESDLLKALDRETHQKVLQPRMLSGSYQGRLLALLSKMIGPKKILEVGTYTGYATLCMAEGLSKGGSIDTVDHNEELADMQRRYFEQSSYGNQIAQHLGEAKDVLKTLSGPYDLVFLDADKENYPHYFDLIIELVAFSYPTMYCGRERSWKKLQTKQLLLYKHTIIKSIQMRGWRPLSSRSETA